MAPRHRAIVCPPGRVTGVVQGKSRKFLSLARGAAVITAGGRHPVSEYLTDLEMESSDHWFFRFFPRRIWGRLRWAKWRWSQRSLFYSSARLVSATVDQQTMDERPAKVLSVGVSFIG